MDKPINKVKLILIFSHFVSALRDSNFDGIQEPSEYKICCKCDGTTQEPFHHSRFSELIPNSVRAYFATLYLQSTRSVGTVRYKSFIIPKTCRALFISWLPELRTNEHSCFVRTINEWRWLVSFPTLSRTFFPPLFGFLRYQSVARAWAHNQMQYAVA